MSSELPSAFRRRSSRPDVSAIAADDTSGSVIRAGAINLARPRGSSSAIIPARPHSARRRAIVSTRWNRAAKSESTACVATRSSEVASARWTGW